MVYPIAKLIFAPIIDIWIKEINGLNNIPVQGPFIITANHESYMDHLIIVKTFVMHLNKKIHFLSKKEHFSNPIKSIWHRWAGAIPLDRESKGTRTLTGKLQRGKTGVARLALAARVPVVPVGLIGTFEILPKGKYIPELKKATMNIGKPLYFDKYYSKKITKKLLREITNKIMKEVAKLCKQEYNF